LRAFDVEGGRMLVSDCCAMISETRDSVTDETVALVPVVEHFIGPRGREASDWLAEPILLEPSEQLPEFRKLAPTPLPRAVEKQQIKDAVNVLWIGIQLQRVSIKKGI
jgi:hypothetical protein